MITWLAKDANFPPANHKRGVLIKFIYTVEKPDTDKAGILIQQALVQTGLLVGRTPEWMDATTTKAESGEREAVLIQMWDKPDTITWDN